MPARLYKLKSPPLMRTTRSKGHSAKRTELTDTRNRARGLGVAPFGALLGALWTPSGSGVCSHLQRWSLFERIGGERSIQSHSNG